MTRLLCGFVALLIACHAAFAEEAPAPVSDGDRAAVSTLLQAAAANAPAEKLPEAIKSITDAALREKLAAFLPEFRRTAETYTRIEELCKMAADVKGKTKLAPGGPDWLRAVAAEEDMRLFAKLIVLDFNNPKFDTHNKAEHTNADVSAWISRIHDLDDLTTLSFQNTQVDDAAVAALGPLKSLESLNIAICPVTDAAIPLIVKYPTLHRFYISSNKKLTGRGFDKLASMKSLEMINLHYTGIDDEGLRQIAMLPAIHQLELGHGEYTDKGIEYLGTITRLKRIQCASKSATPAGLAPLAKLVNMEQLFIFDNLATDESVPFVVNLPKLYFLSLYGPITDKSADALCTLKRLKTLELGGTTLSDAAIDRIKAALPDTEVKGR
jgi:hypothetical protein